MAIAAFREFAHDAGGMRNTVAILTFRDHLVFFLVTGYAEQCLMLCFAGDKHVERFCVTGGALFGRCVSCVGNSFRHMSFVAFLAIARALIGSMSLVALGTLRDFAMNVVAERTVKFAVLARTSLELGNLRGVTGQTRISHVTTKDDLFWLVRIPVALEAATKFEVRFTFMALTAERDDLLVCRRVTVVTVLTSYLGLVRLALCLNVCWGFSVAFDAVGTGQ